MTNDEPQGFTPAPFPQPTPAPLPPDPPKKKGGRRGPRKPKPDKPARKPKRARRIDKMIKNARVRQAAVVAAVPQQGVKLDLATAAAIFGGMSNDDSKLVSGMVITLAALSKEQRKRILAALARVFA